MNRHDIAVATMTLATGDREERLLLDGLQRLAVDRWPVALSDGGSRPAFVHALGSIPSLTLVAPRTRGLVGQVKASIAAASSLETRFVLYTEPDKFEFFDEHLSAFVSDAPEDGDIGIVLAARSEASFKTFPASQRDAERCFNCLCAGAIGDLSSGTIDYCYGPFVMNRVLAAHVDSARDDLGWGWRPFVFAEARRLGFRVVAVVRDLPCPPDQRLDDRGQRIHRMRQLRQNLDGLLLSVDR
jgi:hypothetical protein